MQDNIGPMKNDGTDLLEYCTCVIVSCFLYMHCFSCTPWSQLIIDSGDVMSPSVSKDEKLPGLVIFSSVKLGIFSSCSFQDCT